MRPLGSPQSHHTGSPAPRLRTSISPCGQATSTTTNWQQESCHFPPLATIRSKYQHPTPETTQIAYLRSTKSRIPSTRTTHSAPTPTSQKQRATRGPPRLQAHEPDRTGHKTEPKAPQDPPQPRTRPRHAQRRGPGRKEGGSAGPSPDAVGVSHPQAREPHVSSGQYPEYGGIGPLSDPAILCGSSVW